MTCESKMYETHFKLLENISTSKNDDEANSILLEWIYFIKFHDINIKETFTEKCLQYLEFIELLDGVSKKVTWSAFDAISHISMRKYCYESVPIVKHIEGEACA
jgi:hypothetical protein